MVTLLATPCDAQNKIRREGAVLAYDLHYDPTDIRDDMPDALREMLRTYQSGKRYAERMEGEAVEPLLRTIRDQYPPFSNSCPYYTYSDGTVSAERCISGCVATCIEQVLTYWRHPEALTDTLHGWETEHYSIGDILPGTAIDWGNMLDDYRNGYSEEEASAVADLTYYCGVAARMSWTPTSSGANLYSAIEPLWRAFDYKTIAYVQRALYSDQAWNRLLRNELRNGRPICYTGFNMALSGHAFNIDGVDEQGYYHVNWGYGGDYDGWYDLDYLNPFERWDDATNEGLNEGFFCNQTAMFLHPEDFVIDVYDTLGVADVLYGVTVDTITFRRQPDTQGYVVADFEMTNTTGDSIYFTFEVLTFLPTDTAIFTQADYVAMSSVSIAPHERKAWPVYCQFSEAGERIIAFSTDDATLPYQMAVTIEEGVEPKLSFGAVTHEFTTDGDELSATFTLNVTNSAVGGYAGDLVTYCLFEEGNNADLRHWDVLSVAGGETQRLTTTFQHLTEGTEYELYVRCPWTVWQTYAFTASREEATDCVCSPKEGNEDDDGWHDLQGRKAVAPVRGLYIKHGKKILIR